jgi:hypothetical protein
MLLRVVDLETTGLPPDAAICQISWCDVSHLAGDPHVGVPRSRLVNPGIISATLTSRTPQGPTMNVHCEMFQRYAERPCRAQRQIRAGILCMARLAALDLHP